MLNSKINEAIKSINTESKQFNCIRCHKLITIPENNLKEDYVECECKYHYLISKVGKCIIIKKSDVFSELSKNQKCNINSIANSLRYAVISKFGFFFLCFSLISISNLYESIFKGSICIIASFIYAVLMVVEYKLIRKGFGF